MKSLYTVVVEYATPPLLRNEHFLVPTLADVETVKINGAKNGYRVIDAYTTTIYTAENVDSAITQEKLATAAAIGESVMAHVPV